VLIAPDVTLSGETLLRPLSFQPPDAPPWAPLVEREWLVTNGLGGYSAGTVAGAATRRYHGLLIGSFPPPLGRILLLADLEERLHLDDHRAVRLGGEERPDAAELHGARFLADFRLEAGMPVWTYDLGGVVLEKRLIVPHGRNLVCIGYRLIQSDAPVRLELHPLVHLRSHDAPVDHALEPRRYRADTSRDGIEIGCGEELPSLRIRRPTGCSFHAEPRIVAGLLYSLEASRGYASVGDRWSPGYFRADLEPNSWVGIVAGDEPWSSLPIADVERFVRDEADRKEELLSSAGDWARTGIAARLVAAADSFVIEPPRPADEVSARARGEHARTIIAGYHWFTDWGRDTMISLEGLTLATGRWREAHEILLTFGRHIRDGLIPNMFPEGRDEGLYHTADATLWFFHALHRYQAVTGDRSAVDTLMPRLREIIDRHIAGTHFGIGVDPQDGLLRQGADGYQLTWMDAKVDDWVVTPRRGKAVEINALWYNALCLMRAWEADRAEHDRAARLAHLAAQAQASFNDRFWIEHERYLRDVVDGDEGHDDDAFRPNQIFAVALPHPVLRPDRWSDVVHAVRDRLLTPVGLRSLAPGHPQYRATYFGDLRTRDAAYHQGTVWGWLIGPFIDAWLRVQPRDTVLARRSLDGLVHHLDEACIGSISEVFDAEPPHTPRGCVAQAWSVAEVLRCWKKLVEEAAA